MALESASWISELDATNPPGTDKKKQGDDHFRLIKTVLKAGFPTSSKAWYNPTFSASQTANFSVVASDMNKTFLINTSGGAVTATLPTLAVGDAGWECYFLKTNTDLTAYFIAPPSGTIQSGAVTGLTKTRRSIPGARSRVFWTGAAWIAERVVSVPVGTILDIPHTLPVGYELANGQTLASASTAYPDFYSVNGSSGVVTDRCGRAPFGAAMGLTTAATRLAGVISAVLGNVGGAAKVTVALGNLPSTNLTATGLSGTTSGSLTVGATGQVGNQFLPNFENITVVTSVSGSGVSSGTGTVKSYNSTNSQESLPSNGSVTVNGTATGSLTPSVSGSIALGGSATQLETISPGITTNFMVVVE